MMFGRKAKNKEEKKLITECFKAGMGNDWANGKFAEQDGNFIVEDDRLNLNSIFFIDSIKELRAFFKYGNWCLGQGVIHKDMFFLQQVNGGDEWASFKIKDNLKQWDSISWGHIIEKREFTKYYNDFSKPQTMKEYYKGV